MQIKSTDEINDAISRKESLFFNFWLKTIKRENKEVKVISSFYEDGEFYIEYNPGIFPTEAALVYEYFMLETYRLMLMHCTTRIPNPNLPVLWTASNLTILETMQAEFPLIKLNYPHYTKFGLKKEEFTLESWYKELMKLTPQQRQNADADSSDSDKDNKDKMEGKDGKNDNKGQSKKNSKNDSGSNGDKKQESKNEINIRKSLKQENAESASKKWKNGDPDSEQTRLEQSELIRQRIPFNKIEDSSDGCDSESELVTLAIKEIFSDSGFGSCKKLLKRFIKNAEDDEREESRMKVNRRHDLEQPGLKLKQRSKLIIGIDTSGSVCDEDEKQFKAVLESLADIANIDAVCWGSQVVEESLMKFSDLKRSDYQMYDGGGTNPEKFIQWAHEHKYRSVIVLTDGYFDSQQWAPVSMKICWCLTNEGISSQLNNFNDIYYLRELV
jgi:predicted metal-dependent peptidase